MNKIDLKEKVGKLWDFIETHYTDKDEYPKDLYDILEDFLDVGIENENLKLIISLILLNSIVDYVDFDELEISYKDFIKNCDEVYKEILDSKKRIRILKE